MSESNKKGDGVERWDFSWQGSTGATLDDPPSENWDADEWTNKSRKLAEEEARKKIEMDKEVEQDMQRSMNYMGLGTLFVVGAISANVFTFQRSKWAVGKEIHRAWQRRQSYNAKQQARASASKSTRYSATGGVGNGNRARGEGGFAYAAREAAARAAQAAERAAAEHAFKAASKAAEDARRRGKNRGHWQTYSQSWTNDGTGWREAKGGGGQQAFDAEDLDELFRRMRGERPGGGRSSGRSDLDDFEEMMRGFGGFGGQRGGGRRRSGGINIDAMFEEMMRAAREAEKRHNRGGFSGGPNFWEESGYGPGVHTRESFDGHYKTLGLEKGADENKVKAAYRKLVMKYHPDRYSGDDKEWASNKFREITQAYEALTKKHN